MNYLNSLNFETFHVNKILDSWHTKDDDISSYADTNDLIIITKDHDFRNSFFIKNTPKKLIKISLGNISNLELIRILSENLTSIQKLNNESRFIVEIDNNYITYFK